MPWCFAPHHLARAAAKVRLKRRTKTGTENYLTVGTALHLSSFLGGLLDHFVSLPASASLSCAVAKSIAGPAGTIPVGLMLR
jgi:hypothetical protein